MTRFGRLGAYRKGRILEKSMHPGNKTFLKNCEKNANTHAQPEMASEQKLMQGNVSNQAEVWIIDTST